ncbi:prepilin-type N-terminal cleavage/methylation domain-containing protein [Maricaulis sp.]|uniref:PulJ/GspJ family protein n=1 Tax=Maricaulis sp. TaxID=1486257 RepID=UPI00261B1272|nr:prepilin-type N-terminal cleavage/methylation domain-containing protein [Maricaulis sp.]
MTARQAGFTLIEALVGLALMASISVGLVLVLRGIADAQAGVVRLAGGQESRLLLNETLRDALTYTYRGPDLAGDQFEGTPDGLRTLAQLPGRMTPARIQLRAEGGVVTMTLTPLGAINANSDDVVLIDGLSRARLAYYGKLENTDRAAWYPSWTGPGLPRLVRLEMEEPGRGVWRIEALVGGGASFECDFDSDAGACLNG